MVIIREDDIVIMTENEFEEIKRDLEQRNLKDVEKIILDTTNRIRQNILYLGLFIFVFITLLMLSILFGG